MVAGTVAIPQPNVTLRAFSTLALHVRTLPVSMSELCPCYVTFFVVDYCLDSLSRSFTSPVAFVPSCRLASFARRTSLLGILFVIVCVTDWFSDQDSVGYVYDCL